MAGMFGYSREAVRVKVKKCEGTLPFEWRKFSVDPQITSLEVLYSILAKAFDLRTDFAISYKTIDPSGKEIYLAVLSDWDLDAAFLRAHNLSISTSSEPCLNLKVDIKPFSEASDWDAVSNSSSCAREVSPLQQSIGVGQKYVQTMQTRLPGLIMNQMEKTFSMVSRALNLVEDQNVLQPPRPPLSDTEFRSFLDSVGQIVHPHELRKVIYSGGIDPSLRRVVWKHILNVYPNGMTGRERMDYMKRKAAEYFRLRDTWRTAVQKGSVIGELAYVTSMVRKDVLRTDRLHPFYAGSDDNQNIASLFNILTTYALNHPAVSYCQGMSDIASPLLVTMCDEAQAYICFCAVMTRLNANFMLDGAAMTIKFTHLAEALQHYDPEFYEYLKMQQADDLLFCYRWLLLEMKREFAFEDSLRMLEVLWSALPAEPPVKELALFEKEFQPPPTDVPPPKSPSVVMRTPRENAYTKICALRRQSSALSLVSSSPNAVTNTAMLSKSLDATKRLNQSLDETSTGSCSRVKSVTKSHQSLDESKIFSLINLNDEELAETILSTELELQQINNQSGETNAMNVPASSSSPPPPNYLNVSSKNEENILRSRSTSPSSETTTVRRTNIEHNKHSTSHNNHHHHTKQQHKLQNSITSGLSKQIHHHNNNRKVGGHFKDLKERLANSKKGIFATLDKIENAAITEAAAVTALDDNAKKSATKGQKVVKNFNEFLNFASINKSRISDKLATNTKLTSILNHNVVQVSSTTDSGIDGCDDNIDIRSVGAVVEEAKPLIKLTKSSFDDSDLSSNATIESIPDENQLPPMQQPKPQPLQLQLTNHLCERRVSVDGSSPDDSQEYFPMTTSMTRELRLELESLDRHVFGNDFQIRQQFNLADCDTPESGDSVMSKSPANFSEISYVKLNQNSADIPESSLEEEEQLANEICRCPSDKNVVKSRNRKYDEEAAFKRISTSSANTDIFIWENPLHQFSPSNSTAVNDEERTAVLREFHDDEALLNATMTPDEQIDLDYDGEIIETSLLGKKSVTPIKLLRRNGGGGCGNDAIVTVQSTCSSKRNSVIYNHDSDSDNSTSWNATTEKQFTKNLTVSQQNAVTLQPAAAENQLLSTSVEEATETNIQMNKVTVPFSGANALPTPIEFGGGNPFLMFLCLTLLLQHRNYVIKSNMDYNEMAMHFDKMVRKHNVTRVLNQARRMYADYLKSQKILNAVGGAASGSSSTSAAGGSQNNHIAQQKISKNEIKT